MQLCLAVFRLDLARKEQCTNVCTKITPVPLLSETTKRQNWFLNCSRVEKLLYRVILKLELLGTRVLLIAGVGPLAEQVVVQHHARNLVDPRLVHRSPSCDCACTSFLARSSLVSSVRRGTSRMRSRTFAVLASWPDCSLQLGMCFTFLLIDPPPAVGYALYVLLIDPACGWHWSFCSLYLPVHSLGDPLVDDRADHLLAWSNCTSFAPLHVVDLVPVLPSREASAQQPL